MEAASPSRTALVTSVMRALHTRLDPHRILCDDWGDRLVPAAVHHAIRQRALAAASPAQSAPGQLDEDARVAAWLRGSAAYATVITRSRYTEDALHACLARGCTQYVLVGAGFDSYALRRPALAASVALFELDHPATQAYKRQRIEACGLSLPDSVHFLSADLAHQGLAAVLAASRYDASQPAFFAWLGVTMYLTREANLATLREIGRAAAPGSELVFTYVDQRAFEHSEPGRSTLARSVAALGEPLLSGFDPATLAPTLQALGFEAIEDLHDAQLVERYDPQQLNGMRPSPYSRIVHARVRAQGA